MNHLEEVNQTYFKHMAFAIKTGSLLVLAGGACLVHSVFPFFFTKTASTIIKKLHQTLTKKYSEPLDWVI